MVMMIGTLKRGRKYAPSLPPLFGRSVSDLVRFGEETDAQE